MFRRSHQVFYSNDAFENGIGIGILCRDGYDTRTIDEIDPFHQGNILPDFGFSRNRCNVANLLLFESVDDATFPNVWISNETDRNLFLVRVEDRELSKKLNEGTFSERVVDGGMESDGRSRKGEMFDPTSLKNLKRGGVSISSNLSNLRKESQSGFQMKACLTSNYDE